MNTEQRYERQVILPELGIEGQREISKASVLCIGAGGLGCSALLYLAAAGIGQIGVVDFDTVDETNLQRQILFTTDQIGQSKATAAKERLNALNPNIDIQAYTEELTDKNATSLFKYYDIIIDGTDNFVTKFLINDAALKTGKPFVYGSILGFDGQLAVFNYKGGPCYRCLFPAPPEGHIPNCAEAGVIGAVAGIVGTVQAMEAIKIIVEHESFQPVTGKLWTIDMRSMENNLLSLSKNPACPVCSKSKKDILLKYPSPICSIVPEITPEQAKKHIGAILIDVREQEEWNTGHIHDARHISLSSLIQGYIPNLPADSNIIIYCQKGPRGQQAAQILKSQKYKDVSNMTGGYEAWLEKKLSN